MSKNFTVLKGKVIRDPIHGDIFFPDKYLAIIDTPEFQRLRRIHQLSVAYLVFPGADHSRFSHSIGTYYIMQKIIDHINPIMKSINYEVKERDINLALAAALLHDIGHGPFSHAFEKAINNVKDHEQWGIAMILDEESNINKVLKVNFDEKFPEDLADIIRKERTVKQVGDKHKSNVNEKKIDLFFILSGLISSQLDADRMDYLLRDAKYTGVKSCNIDIERLIGSITLTVYRNEYYVCFIDKYLSDIESYLFTRYQMHKDIYLHDVKCEMEIIIQKIFERVIYLLNNTENTIEENKIPEPLLKLLRNNEISTKEYAKLDDNTMLSFFSKCIECKDVILSELCSCIINRKRYNKVHILNNEPDQIESFKIDLRNILKKIGYNFTDYSNEYFWIEAKESYNIYKKEKDNIWILKDDGIINDICNVSSIINERLNGEKTMAFINYDILRSSIEQKNNVDVIEDAIEDVDNLIKLNSNRNHIEIEKKYILDNRATFEKVKKAIYDLNIYEIRPENSPIIQEDYYYDTRDELLFRTNKTLRLRKIKDEFRLTIKKPTKSANIPSNCENSQSERFEYETSVECANIEGNKQYIIKYLPEISEDNKLDDLINALIVKNKREKMNLINNTEVFEIVFDDVTYINSVGVEKSDLQIEIELKSDYLHRINLKMLTDYLEETISGLKPLNESKFIRGLTLTNSNI